MARDRQTVVLSLSLGRELAHAVARAIEGRRMTISDAVGTGLAMWLDAVGEHTLAAMVCDGRGTLPRTPKRHK